MCVSGLRVCVCVCVWGCECVRLGVCVYVCVCLEGFIRSYYVGLAGLPCPCRDDCQLVDEIKRSKCSRRLMILRTCVCLCVRVCACVCACLCLTFVGVANGAILSI